MSKGILYDPINYTKRPPYGESKPGGQLFANVVGFPDNKFVDEKFLSAIKLGAVVGFNYGLFGTVLKDQPNLLARDKFLYYGAKCTQGALRGGVVGAMYALVVTGSCKARGDKDDALNHFLGGFGFSSQWLVKGDWHGFMVYGLMWGTLAGVAKYLYMNNFEFAKNRKDDSSITNCRYPELYMRRAKAPSENLE